MNSMKLVTFLRKYKKMKKYKKKRGKKIELYIGLFESHMNSMKLVIPLHSLHWSIHTKDESKGGTAFAFIFGVN